MILYHAGNQLVEFPEVRKAKYTKDFSWGFYCTNSMEQAKKWAIRHDTPTINTYEYTEDTQLNILKFETMTDSWLDFIVECRSGKTHRYDIVEGAMADDTIWNYIEEFIAGDMPRHIFWEYMKFKHPTHQISFHTIQALECLKFVRSEVITFE